MGTGITTGPYQITAGQTISLNDPAKWSIASETIQLQNNTGFTIYVQSSGAGYNIQPFTVSTIPCAGGQTLVAVVSSTANVAVGFLTAVWLLPGQTGPMPDGPMTVFPKQISNLTVTQSSYQGGPYYYYLISGLNPAYNNITLYYTGTVESPYYLWLGNASVGNLFGPGYAPPGSSSVTIPVTIGTNTTFYLWYGNASNAINYVTSQYVTNLTAVQTT